MFNYELGPIIISYRHAVTCATLFIKGSFSFPTLAPLFMGVFMYMEDVWNLSDRSASWYWLNTLYGVKNSKCGNEQCDPKEYAGFVYEEDQECY